MMKHTRQYTKRLYRPNLSLLAAYLQPLKVNPESIQTISGETIMCQPITKRMTKLGKVSRGLDQSHPEHNRKPRYKLSRSLRKAIKQVYQLEQEHEELLISRWCLIDLVVELAAWQEVTTEPHVKIPSDKLQDIVWAMMECLDMLEDAPAQPEQVTA